MPMGDILLFLMYSSLSFPSFTASAQVNDYLAKYLLAKVMARRINAIKAATPLLKIIATANNIAATTIAPKTNHFFICIIKFPGLLHVDRNARQSCHSL